MPQKSEVKNRDLQVLRGIAILLVAIFHFTWRWQDFYSWGKYVNAPWFFITTNGVALFFMISGWVIFSSLTRTSKLSVFTINRMMRLAIPLLFIAPILFLFQKLFPTEVFKEVIPGQVLTSIMMINPSYLLFLFDIRTDWITGVQWTLTYEITFYLLSSVVFFKISKKFAFEIMFFSTNLILVGNYLYLYLNDQIGRGYYVKDVNSPSVEYVIQQSGLLHLSWFVLGMWFFKYRSTPRDKKSWIYVMNLTFLCAWDISQGRVAFSQPKQTALALLILIIFIVLFILIGFKPSKYKFYKIRTSLEALGNVSYEFYLLHEIIGVTILVNLSNYAILASYPEIWPLVICIVILMLYKLSYFVNKFFSIPLQTFVKAKVSNKRSKE